MLALLQQLQPATLDWVGTSMGGLIGMAVAGLPEAPGVCQGAPPGAQRRRAGDRVARPCSASATIWAKPGAFDSEQQAADAMWAISSSFGPHTPAQWLALTRPMLKPLGDGSGRLTLHYDPAIAVPFKALTPESAAQGEACCGSL